MRRLEHDLNRFTIELEADTAGITEILEQSTREMIGHSAVQCIFFCMYISIESYMLDRPPSPERPPVGQSMSYVCVTT